MLREKLTTYKEAKKDRKDAAKANYDSAPERDLENLRTDAAEILGGSKELRHIFRDRYRYATDRLVSKANILEQKNIMLNGATQLESYMGENGTSLAQQKAKENRQAVEKAIKGRREHYLSFRSNRTKIKIDRINSKIDNSSNSFLSRQINRQRRQTVNILTTKNEIRSRAAGKIETKRKEKPEELRKKIDTYVKKKVDAMYRKAQREALKEKRIGKRNFVQRAEFIAKMTPEKKKEIMREAILLARKNNIERGRLEADYEVDNTLNTRKVDEYERTIE